MQEKLKDIQSEKLYHIFTSYIYRKSHICHIQQFNPLRIL